MHPCGIFDFIICYHNEDLCLICFSELVDDKDEHNPPQVTLFYEEMQQIMVQQEETLHCFIHDVVTLHDMLVPT